MNRTLAKVVIALFATTLGSTLFVGDAFAKSSSLNKRGGVKCYYVLVSQSGGTYTWQQVCKRGA
jgi:hypothetical protein